MVKANARAPIYTRIEHSKIAVVWPQSLVRNPKRPVVMKLTTERFRYFIKDLYKRKENGPGQDLMA